MAAENKSMTDTEIMLGELNRIVSEEMAKKPSVRDEKLIDECIEEMAKLKNVRAGYNKEEIGTIIEEIQAKVSGNPKQKPVPRKSVRRTIAAACAACLIMVCGVATVAWNPFHVVCDWFYEILESPTGTISNNGITYTMQGREVKYRNIEELFQTENLNIYYPALSSRDFAITKIEKLAVNDSEYIYIRFTDPTLQYIVHMNTPMYLTVSEYEIFDDNGVEFYISYQDNQYIARGRIDSNLYLIESPNYQNIITILNSITKGEKT